MAEIDDAVEIIEEAEQGIDAEAEGLDGEALAEVEAEADEAEEASKELGSVVKSLKEMGNLTLSFVKFVVKNAAIGAIMFGVTVALKKLMVQQPNNEECRRKYDKIRSISNFIKSASVSSQKVCNWLKAHQNDMITLEGIEVPLVSIFVKYTTPLANAADQELDTAKQLQTKTSDGKTTFLTPNASQVAMIITSGQKLVDALRNFQEFAAEKSNEFPTLKSLPLTKQNVDELQQNLDAIKNMPF